MNLSVDAYFSYSSDGSGYFTAALFDVGGLYYNPAPPPPPAWGLIGDETYDIQTSF